MLFAISIDGAEPTFITVPDEAVRHVLDAGDARALWLNLRIVERREPAPMQAAESSAAADTALGAVH